MGSLGRLSADFRDFFVILGTCWVTFGFSSLEGAQGAGTESGYPGDPPGRNFKTIFGDSLRRLVS